MLRHRFINTLKTALPEDVLSKDGLLKVWSPMARDEGTWEEMIGLFFMNAESGHNGIPQKKMKRKVDTFPFLFEKAIVMKMGKIKSALQM